MRKNSSQRQTGQAGKMGRERQMRREMMKVMMKVMTVYIGRGSGKGREWV